MAYARALRIVLLRPEYRRMQLEDRLLLLIRLGTHLRAPDDYLDAVIHRTAHRNLWFTEANQRLAIEAIATQMLDEQKLRAWVAAYALSEPVVPQVVGLVLAGNIPLVGFHDVLCTFVAGHRAQIKLSEKDQFLLPYLLELLGRFDPRANAYFELVQRLHDFDAVIATGSNNTSRYFEQYFGKYPHIIRRNRNAVAVLSGEETDAQLLALGDDIFRYFGMGCRNVSKLYVPEGYDFNRLLEVLHDNFKQLVRHSKYKNNYDHNSALYILNQVPFYNNGCLLLTENDALTSPIAGLHYSYYQDLPTLEAELNERAEEIQCVVSELPLRIESPLFSLGQAQRPGLADYADGVDTLAFLRDI